MSCRIGRHGQIKGDSAARAARERELNQRVFWRRGKKMTTQPRKIVYGGIREYGPDSGKYSGVQLRALRALRGVGPAIRINFAFSHGV